MKKLLLLISVFIFTFSNAQQQDTICHAISGKKIFEFNYSLNEIIDREETENFEDFEIEINENEFLVLDLYDDCKCAKHWKFNKSRKITAFVREKVYTFDGEKRSISKTEAYVNESGDETLHFDGFRYEKIIVSKPLPIENNAKQQDTICHAVSGKIHFEFNYGTSEITNKHTSENFEDIVIDINENEFLVFDLYDDCECAKHWKFNKFREITLIMRNEKGMQLIDGYESGNESLELDGSIYKKIIVSKPLPIENNYR
jgi:hypothetical protein